MSRYLEAAALASASMLALMTASMAQEAAAPTPEAPVSVARAPNDDIRLRQAVTVEGMTLVANSAGATRRPSWQG